MSQTSPPASARTRRSQVERRAESSRRLLAAAAELIAEKGFELTTAAEIGERAGYSRSMVRAKYGSKDALLETLLGGEYRELMRVPEDQGDQGLDRAVAHISRTRIAAGTDPTLLRAFYFLCFESLGPRPDLRRWTHEWTSTYQASLANALRDGIADGSVRADLDVDHEADTTLTHGLGQAFRWLFDERSDFVERLLDREEFYRARWRSST